MTAKERAAPAEPGCALVTGGSRGIGRAIVLRLLGLGWRVAFTYRERADLAEQLAAAAPERAASFALDLRDRARPKELVGEVEQRLGAIVALVNNAGMHRSQLVAMTSDALWDEVVDGNLGGTFRLTRAVLPGMVLRRQGAIVNVASLGALRGVTGQGAYAAAKGGVLALTRTLAREMGTRGIRVNAVVPGYVATDLTLELPASAVDAMRSAEALPGGVTAEAVAGAVAFLLSPESAATTGQSLIVDAGVTA